MARDFKQKKPKGGLPGWMATYGDLVTLMLCFFVLLFSMSSVDAKKYKAVVESINQSFGILRGGDSVLGDKTILDNGVFNITDFQTIRDVSADQGNEKSPGTGAAEDTTAKEIAENIEGYFSEVGLENQILVSYAPNFVKMTIAGELLFDSGEATIKQGERVLAAINEIIVTGGYTKYMLNIEGHTDNKPINTAKYPSNWYLSSARAIAVGESLIQNYKFNPEMILCTGYGEYRPIASNDTPDGRAQNRRVEFGILLNHKK